MTIHRPAQRGVPTAASHAPRARLDTNVPRPGLRPAPPLSARQIIYERLGTPSDANGSGGEGLLALPEAPRIAALRKLNREPVDARSLEDKAAAAAVLAEATVDLGSDRRAMRYLLKNYRDVFESDEGLAAIKTVWNDVHAMPLDRRVHLLYLLTPSLSHFPGIERSARFDEHFNAWAEVAERHPRALHAAQAGHLSPLAVLSNLVEYLPSHCHDQARKKIGALATASLSLGAVAGPR